MSVIKTDASAGGTHLQGYITASYEDLVTALGEPQYTGYELDKSDAEWVLSTPHGVATVYNYKDGFNYLGASGSPVEKITDWHVGGLTPEVVADLTTFLGLEA